MGISEAIQLLGPVSLQFSKESDLFADVLVDVSVLYVFCYEPCSLICTSIRIHAHTSNFNFLILLSHRHLRYPYICLYLAILTFLFSRRYTSIQIIRKCVLVLALLCAGLWFIKVDNNCKIFEENSFCV